MAILKKLQEAKTRDDLAKMLGFTPSGFTYVLYKIPDGAKYHTFEIPKRSGGTRQIDAPEPRLRLLQRRLADVIYECLQEIEAAGTGRHSLAHGFERNRSIVTNASLHKRRRYVLNLDLEDFFPSINFGRVRGFFLKDKNFAVDEKIATTIAQIVCHDHKLPQGSPCSPVISNLVGHILDVRLVGLAKQNKCTYSRYVDDITFSTNQKDFPAELAKPDPSNPPAWVLGSPLIARIEGSGFKINRTKTRMQIRGSRQVATGLMVNAKVNIRPEYYRIARSMCHELFATGSYFRLMPPALAGGKPEDPAVKVRIGDLSKLEGVLAHINHVKRASQQTPEKGAHGLYSKFLFYKNFVVPEAPLIVPEGKTDSIYLRLAMKKLTAHQPQLGKFVDGKFIAAVRFLNFTRSVHEFMKLGNGSGAITALIYDYKRKVDSYGHAPLAHPVILLIDNDDGANDVFKAARRRGVSSIAHTSADDFYRLYKNLYLIKTPEIGADSKSCIESFFDPTLVNTVVNGRKFNPAKDHGSATEYGKVVFAEQVIRPNTNTIDFTDFAPLLNRIVAVLNDYANVKLVAPVSAVSA